MIASPKSEPAVVAIEVASEVIAFVANSLNRPGFGPSGSDSARTSNANCSASVRTRSSVTAGSASSMASTRAWGPARPSAGRSRSA
jgi:hypothetical protein